SGSEGMAKGGGSVGVVSVRRNASHSEAAERVRRQNRRVESFRFNPNTVSIDDLVRLGFSEKQAQAIDSYRQKGGRFRRPSDFARSYVVADSVFARLEPYIVIPKTDINRADSAAFDALPGIGPYFAARMVEYRGRLGGYSYKEQLLDIYRFDQERLDGQSDLLTITPPRPFRLWSMSEDSLRLHPYIRTRQAAHSIALYRSTMPRDQWTVQALASAGILPPEDAARLARCVIEEP
ncbi:MAG: helix-hairpin-helix domain-containing protein, partial [Bacteroidales bacterium]|nr:helix-hairpin-helix domain-containing protein [Bacteroidales bacterium]